MQVNAILRNALVWGLFLTPLIPLIVATSPLPSLFFPYITGKNFTFRILVELTTAGWLILALRDTVFRPRRSLLLIAIALFSFIVALADVFSVNAFKSVWSNFERMEGLVTIAHLFLYFLVLSAMLRSEGSWRGFWHVSLGAAFVASSYALTHLLGWFPMHQGDRPDSTLGNATYLAGYLLFHVFLAGFLFIRARQRSLRWVYGILGAFYAAIVYLTASRGAFLGLLAGLLVAAAITALWGRENRHARQWALGIIIGIAVLGGFFLAVRHTDFVRENHVLGRLASISLEEGKSRFLIWNMAWQGFRDRPLLGWGQESFNFVFSEYYDPQMYDQESWFDRVHNVFLDWLIAAGGLGLLSYLSLYAAALISIWRRGLFDTILERAILTGLIVAYAVHNFFVFDNIASYLLFFSLLAFLSVRAGAEVAPLLGRFVPSRGVIDRIVTPLILVAVIWVVYAINIRGILAAHDLVQALSFQESGIEVNLAQFKQALSRNSFGEQEVREQTVSAANQLASLSVDPALKSEFFTFARTEMQKQIDRVPNDPRFDLFMASLLDTYQQYPDAIPYLKRALELSPKKQITLFEVGSNLLNQGQTEEALMVLKQAYELAPKYNTAAFLYSAGAIYAGQQELADKILSDFFGDNIPPDQRLIQAYSRTGQFDKARVLLEKSAAANPGNWQVYVSLAALYLELGRRQDAVTAFEKSAAIKSDEEFQKQAVFFIQEIKAGRNP